jgi:hypothetical protein
VILIRAAVSTLFVVAVFILIGLTRPGPGDYQW